MLTCEQKKQLWSKNTRFVVSPLTCLWLCSAIFFCPSRLAFSICIAAGQGPHKRRSNLCSSRLLSLRRIIRGLCPRIRYGILELVFYTLNSRQAEQLCRT
uniref:Uncharacterized protein n=1 Tax=Arundo donax TaxID=35708 RepID=A0A0A8ZKJ3_ARUDO